MKNTKLLARQAALISAVILGSTAGVSAQNNQGQSSGQYNQGQITGQYNQGGTTGQTNQGQYNLGQPGIQIDRQAGAFNADRGTNNQSLQVTKISKGSSLIGATIKNPQGEKLGKVRDLVIDFNSGQVAYLVLETDAGTFRSEKMHAVPVRAFQPNADGTSLVLNADKTQLEASAGFDKDNWPTAATSIWGAQPSWKNDTDTTPTLPQRNTDGWNTGNETNRMGRGGNDTNRLNKTTR